MANPRLQYHRVSIKYTFASLPAYVLAVPIQKVTFERDDRFAGPSSPENDQAWGALMPVGYV